MSKIRNIFLFCSLVFSLVFMLGGNIALAKTKHVKRNKTAMSAAAKKRKVNSVNINNASVSSLAKVKGIGRKTAKAIVNYRTKNGAFKSLDDLLKVKNRTINKKWLNKFSKFLTV